jgi:membrane-associated protease RseP (regulator of RpoE activity)
LITIFIDGWFRTGVFQSNDNFLTILLYTLSVIGIIGTTEIGHMLTCRYHGMNSSPPFFIPGMPSILPTFGAIITAKEPPINRNNLFDLGLSGPISGLSVTIIVAITGAHTSKIISIQEMESLFITGNLVKVETLDYFSNEILKLFFPNPNNGGLILSPLIFASSLGFLITFLNIMPAWQLDGGHMARAIFRTSHYKIATYISVILFFLGGFILMGLLILLLSRSNREMIPLDNISPLSNNRRIVFLLVIILAALLYFFTLRNNPFFLI